MAECLGCGESQHYVVLSLGTGRQLPVDSLGHIAQELGGESNATSAAN